MPNFTVYFAMIKIRWIIIVSTVGLIGLTVTQAFWITKTIQVTQEQINHRVDMAMEDVLEELTDFSKAGHGQLPKFEKYHKQDSPKTVLDVVDTLLLADLLHKYSVYHKLPRPYYYSIVRSADKQTVFSTMPANLETGRVSTHSACLSCIWKEDYYHLSMFFPSPWQGVFSNSFTG
ncbi:MAG: hypothetical protein HC896_05160 [Bacteroidales bacterium]|nr:hypothetical protein [Bacteroidales bacterium]